MSTRIDLHIHTNMSDGFLSPKEVAEIIRVANGKVVLAHPVAYVHEDNLTK